MTRGELVVATLRKSIRVAIFSALVLALVALVVKVSLSGFVRAQVPVDFATIEKPSVLPVLGHNLPLASLLFLLATCVQTPLVRGLADALLATGLAANLLLAGAFVGAWGLPALRVVGVYGSLELAGFSVAIAHYLQARDGEEVAAVHNGLVSAGLLVLAAVVEAA